jgi:hypothetical protein
LACLRLRLAVFGVVRERLPRRLGDRGDRVGDPELHAHTDRVRPAGLLQARDQLLVPERRVGTQQLLAAGAGALDARDQFVSEAQHAARAARRAFAQPHVQDLAGVRV